MTHGMIIWMPYGTPRGWHMARVMWCTWNKWLTLSHVLHDLIKGKKKIKKMRKKNMVMTSGQGGKCGEVSPI